MRRQLGTIWILDGDAIDGEEDFGAFADGKIAAEGCARNHLDLCRTVPFCNPQCVLSRFGDEPLLKSRFRHDLKPRILQMKPVLVAALDDEAFIAAALEPAVEHGVFDVEVSGKTFPIEGAAARSERVDDLELLAGGIRGDAVGEAMGLFPRARVDHHLAIDEAPEDESLGRFFVRPVVFHVHE